MDNGLPPCLEKLLVQHKTLEDELENIQGFVNSYRPMRDNYQACCELIRESCEDRHQYDEALSEQMNILANIQALATSYKATQKERGPRTSKGFLPKEKKPKKAASFKFGVIKSRKPAWRFHQIDVGADGFGFKLDSKQFENMLDRLKSFESLTWSQIMYERRDDSNHFTEVAGLSKQAQDRLRELNLDDLDHLIQLRINKPTRLWGFFVGNDPHLHLLWYDPEHKVFASKA